ncbi:MAG: Vitamin B12 import ATP-binding protein BtuD [Chlamydiales bacterium]|nr:Vitamin B12 import ATP-binding protein BtuD [Chlamydiales bacterium]MCH9636065.1 Vitamin B12 import ATP-binding protein BtuD [Chlamydiales bacterium]MCH9703224.1 ATP-binding cassette domain-containing protein [Chlamydiota bacterium]
MSAVKVSNLQKKFRSKKGDFVAVDSLSFSIPKGECVAFIGPNGAGKSTTIKMLTGVMQPTTGDISILGFDPHKQRKKLASQMSVLFGHCSKLWFHLPVQESFDLLAAIYGLEKAAYLKRKDELVELFGVSHLIAKPVRQLSLGERMRCELLASFLHTPQMVFLDEPTIGLDITAKAMIRDLLRTMCKELGCTLLLTSHDTDDVERLCDRVILINKGSLVVDDSVDSMKKNYLRTRIVTAVLQEAKGSIELEGVKMIESENHRLVCEIDLDRSSVNVVVEELMKRFSICDLTIEGPSLESVIEGFYR